MSFILNNAEAVTQPPAHHQLHLPAAWDHCAGRLEALYGTDEEVRGAFTAFAGSVQQAYFEGTISLRDAARIIQGIEFSAEKHQFQVRKNENESHYIIHPIGVANHVMVVGGVRDADVIIAALLHDTVEDTNTSFEEIKRQFGERVEGMVRELTDDKSLPKAERKQLQIDHAPHKSPGAAMVKLSDKFYNCSDLLRETPKEDGQPWPQERVDAYFEWAKKVVDALPAVNAPLKEAFDQVYQSRQ